MSIKQDFCRDWSFKEGFDADWTTEAFEAERVNIPHTAVELAFDYFDEKEYQREFTYQKKLSWDPSFAGKEVSLVFDGAMANSKVYVDGKLVGGHADGYTPFDIRLTDYISKDGNLITVCVDGSENPEIPPFGGQIDYLTYAGIYREVWLKVSDAVSISNVKIETTDVLSATKSVKLDCYLSNPTNQSLDGTWSAEILDQTGKLIASQSASVVGDTGAISFEGLEGIGLWATTEPTLYRLRLSLECGESRDQIERQFGFRKVEFSEDGFRLNGEKLKLFGLNRHQSFPYSGYAQGRASQEKDAEIVKFDLACNIVRTSHYPQSTWFLDHCDKIGLLVLEEIPGWQHIGGEEWKNEAVRNVRRMIERDWNHPSIILWGVRINESEDDDPFYLRTNNLAHKLDQTRQTGGIRKDAESTLLEDVYTFNDFAMGEFEHPLSNRPRTALRDQTEVTGLSHKVPYMVTEYNGHMFPTKVSDQEQRQVEHVTRHLEVLNAAHGDDNIAGCIGWCMFDYNTHKDFGSGDRVCHHGVMTMFREPKFAAYAYGSQGDPKIKPVLEPVTYWARGERNIGGTLPLMILTNCDFVRMTTPTGGSFDIYPDRETYPDLPHPPAVLRFEDIEDSELGKWGMQWTDVEFIGMLDGKEIVSKSMVADPVATTLSVIADIDEVDANFEEVRISVKALDQVGNLLPFIDASIKISVSGPGKLIGPSSPTLRGGATGCWIRTSGELGDITVTVSSPRFETAIAQLSAV